MDFNDTAEEATFRAEARAFLEQHLEPKPSSAVASQTEMSGDAPFAIATPWRSRTNSDPWTFS